jgi:short-subunit dehydrogenase
MKNIAIVGAGPGLALAKKFGANGFRPLLISCTQSKLDERVQELNNQGFESKGYVADLYDADQVKNTFDAIKKRQWILLMSSNLVH